MKVFARFLEKKIIIGLLIAATLLACSFYIYEISTFGIISRSIGVTNAAKQTERDVLNCTKSHQKFLIFPAGHYCLRLLAESYCYDGLPVPKLVHYVMFNMKNFYFYNLLSVLSSYRILRPCFIFIHGNVIPEGKWWNHLLDIVPNIVFINTEIPHEIFQNKVNVIQHQSDVVRLRVMLEYGGIYMDTDQIALKSFDKFRKYQITLSKGTSKSIGNAVIIADKRAPFLRIWYLSYYTFDDKQWGFHSCVLPFKLATLLPKLVNMEGYTFFGFEKSVFYIFQGICDWSHRYSLHLYYSLQKRKNHVKDYSPEEIKNMTTTFGEVARFIYFGQLPKKRKTDC